jgi:hypothetical protein
MQQTLARVRARLTYANTMATIAVFIALGGTTYAAATLPRDSVGTKQVRTGGVGKSELRTNSVGKAELRTGAVGKSEIATNGVGAAEVRKDAINTTELKDAGIQLADISGDARNSLAELSGVTVRVAVTSAGVASGGNAKGASRTAVGEYTVDAGRDVSSCQLAATLAGVKTGSTTEAAKPGLITANADSGANTVKVSVKDAAGAPQDAPFHLLAAC